MNTRMYALALSALVGIFACHVARAQDAEREIASIAQSLAEQLIAKERSKVTALDFTDIQGRPNELGRYLAEQIAVELVAVKGITVLDRTNIASIMAEHQLTAEGLVKPENAKKLGQFANVDAILIGNLAGMEDSAVLTIKAISTETAEIVAAGRAKLPLTKDLRRMLDRSVGGNSGASGNGSGAAGAVAAEGTALATKELGPLTMILRSVAGYSVTDDRRQVPAVRFTFDLENRDLQRSISVASNLCVEAEHAQRPLQTTTHRGDLVDSNGGTWKLVATRGIATLACFEQEKGRRTQRNASGIVEYLRFGQQWDSTKNQFGTDSQDGRLWTGSMTPIPPGKSIRASFEFVRSGGENQRTPTNHPAWFQLDAELIVGIFAEGEEPLKSKNLTLQTLNIDRVTASEAPKGP